MNAPTAAADAETSPSVESIVEAEISNLVTQLAKQESPKPAAAPEPEPESEPAPAAPIVNDAERIRASVGRLTTSSITELNGLTSQLEELQQFLKVEVERVEREIESALAGINIIIETITPWRSITESLAAPRRARAQRAEPEDDTAPEPQQAAE
jgi:hypothetical protein